VRRKKARDKRLATASHDTAAATNASTTTTEAPASK
jgi:hypothetical protein